jgi:hypothetical protein
MRFIERLFYNGMLKLTRLTIRRYLYLLILFCLALVILLFRCFISIIACGSHNICKVGHHSYIMTSLPFGLDTQGEAEASMSRQSKR